MTKVLVIIAHPAPAEYSKSQQVGNKFIANYIAQNPAAQVTTINLYDIDAPDVDRIVYSAFGQLMTGATFDSLTTEQQQALMQRQAVIDQFMAHDRYVFVSPMWEFSFPAVLKKYLDTICAVRQTFKYSDIGLPVGLLTNKKAVYIQACGGNHTLEGRAATRPFLAAHPDADTFLPVFDTMGNYGEPIVKATLAIMGVLDYQHIAVHSQAMPDFAPAVLDSALAQAEQLAQQW